MPKHIFIDCSETFESDHVSGIERVVQNLVAFLPGNYGLEEFFVHPVVGHDDFYLIIDKNLVCNDKLMSDIVSKRINSGYVQFLLRKLNKNTRWYFRIFLQKLHVTSIKHRSLKWLVSFIYSEPYELGIARAFRAARRFLRLSPPPGYPIIGRIERGDRMDGNILLLPETPWRRRNWSMINRFKQAGGSVVTLIHDIMPIDHPDKVGNFNFHVYFAALIAQRVKVSDAFICVSEATANDMRRHLVAQNPNAARLAPVGAFHLGADLPLHARQALSAFPRAMRIFDPNLHVFTMVGSIAPHKNHTFVLDAFEQYWQSGGTARIIFIGRQSWDCEDFLNRVQHHAELGKRLDILRDVDDAELEVIFQHSAALIMASSVEGFGLPVVEAQQRGLPVLCSDIPIFHEVAGDHATFFSLSAPSALTQTLHEFEIRHPPGQSTIGDTRQCLTWRESSTMLMTKMMELLELSA